MTRLRLPAWTVIFTAAALLLWPALLQGRPFVFYDSDGYRAAGLSVLSVLRGVLVQLTGHDAQVVQAWSMFAPGARETLTYMGARSPYYGVFLVATWKAGGPWLTLYIQALAAAWALWTWMRAAAPTAGVRAYLTTVAGLALATSLPFYAAFLMPDLWTATALVCAMLLLVYADRLKPPTRIAAWALLAAAMTFHTSTLLVVLGVLILAFLVTALRSGPRPAALRCAAPAAAIAAAVAALAAYPLGVRALPGPAEIHNPPFLTARVLADGPGRSYLAAACDRGDPYVLCAFRGADLTDSDIFLWEEKAGGGVYQVATVEQRMALLDEQSRFVAGTVAHAPFRQIGASLGNWAAQLGAFHVAEPITAQAELLLLPWGGARLVPDAAAACRTNPAACEAIYPVGPLRWLHGAALLLTLGFLAWRLSRPDLRRAFAGGAADPADGETGRVAAAAALLLAFVLVNAAVCGVLSGPAPRYEARIAWLMPALAAVVALALPLPRLAAPAWLRRIEPTLLRYVAVGGGGFVVDATIAHLLVLGAHLDVFVARLISFAIAVVFTWLFNRHWTFGARRNPRRVREAASYFVVQGLGALANLGTYALVLTLAPGLKAWLIVPLACGAAAGLCVTYVGAARFVFARTPAE